MATRVAPAPRERESEAFSRLAARLEDVGAYAAGERIVGFIFEKYGVGQAQGDLKAAEGKVDEIVAFAKAIGPESASMFFAKAYWNPETLTDSRVLGPRTAEVVKGFGSGPAACVRVGDYFEAILKKRGSIPPQ
ncbi:MAG: hypothetical protein PHF51_04030 [Candidatus ainarchaeum sp.]|nr:hypothetical protein [Candidatus ainarchaeum sp.]